MKSTVTSDEWFKEILRPPMRMALGALSWIEDKTSPKYDLRYNPTFIIGPPRCASTLLYQLVAYTLSVSYFTNLTGRLRIKESPSLPILSARLVKASHLTERHQETFANYYGYGKGWGGPHTGEIWSQWFPDGYVSPGELCERERQGVYQAVAATERIFDRPFVSKALNHSVRIRALVEIFPDALFVQSLRDPLDMAQSIYLARTRDFPYLPRKPEDLERVWFSVKPKEYESIKDKSLIEQVCEQVYFVERNISADRTVVGEERFHFVHYEDLCHDPQREVEKIADFMSSHGAPTRIVKSAPVSFVFSSGRKVDKDTYLTMAQCLEALYERPMKLEKVSS